MTNTNTNAKNFSEVITELEVLYKMVNEQVFAKHAKKINLPMYLTVQSKGKRNAYGWCYVVPNWKDTQGNAVAYEINIAAETLGRPLGETFVTLVHEMVHLYNAQEGIKDCAARSNRHNKNFGKTCDLIGLANGADSLLGWSTHYPIESSSLELQDLLKAYAASNHPEYLAVNRDGEVKAVTKKKAKSNQIKYVCPCCGVSVRATRLVNIRCSDCDCKMEIEY